MDDKEEYTTIFHSDKAIPMLAVRTNGRENTIHMDTLREKEGLHFWIGHHRKPSLKEIESKEYQGNEDIHESLSVRLTREDARNLIREIKARLF